jgi:hypothetical protein
MARYSTIVSYVEALQVSEENKDALQKLMNGKGDVRPYLQHEIAAVVETPAGVKVATPGDYVYKSGEHCYVKTAAEFEAVYEKSAVKA